MLLDAEGRYPTVEKLVLVVVVSVWKLRSYFQSYSIIVLTTQPLCFILHRHSQSRRLVKWDIELSEYDIEYRICTIAKSQVFADFIIKLTTEKLDDPDLWKKWILHVDRSSS